MKTVFANSIVPDALMPIVILCGMIAGLSMVTGVILAMFRWANGGMHNTRNQELVATLVAVLLLGFLIIGCQYSKLIAECAL